MSKLEEGKIPCKVITEKAEDGDEIIFVFKDNVTAWDYRGFFPSPFYHLVCWDGFDNAYWCKRTTVH